MQVDDGERCTDRAPLDGFDRDTSRPYGGWCGQGRMVRFGASVHVSAGYIGT